MAGRSWLRRRKMPVPAKRTKVGLASPLHADDGRGVQRVALRAIPAFAGAHALTLLAVRLFHRAKSGVRTRPVQQSRGIVIAAQDRVEGKESHEEPSSC